MGLAFRRSPLPRRCDSAERSPDTVAASALPRSLIILALVVRCAGAEEDGEVPVCEPVSDDCARGAGGFDVCCSSRGCSWVAWDGRAFTSAGDAWAYCAVKPGLGLPASDTLGDTDRSSGPRGTSAAEPSIGDVPGELPGDGMLEGGTRDPAEETGSPSSPTREEEADGGGSGSSAASSSSSGGACYGSPISCGARYTSSSCEQDYSGCFWQEYYCGGAAYSCGYFSSASNCNAHGGCAWSYYYNDCRGGAWQCHNLYTRGACYDQLGCYWIEGGCFGSAGNCGSRASRSSCNGIAGCYWQ